MADNTFRRIANQELKMLKLARKVTGRTDLESVTIELKIDSTSCYIWISDTVEIVYSASIYEPSASLNQAFNKIKAKLLTVL